MPQKHHAGVRQSLGWYARRLRRMSLPEVAHRLREQARKAIDSRKPWGWEGFGHFGGPLQVWPRLTAFMAAEISGASEPTGSLKLLGQDWPPCDLAAPSIWHLDPVTGKKWAGRETFAFHAPYRHAAGMGDVKFVWELNRLQNLQALGAAGNFAAVTAQLDSWMDANPPFRGINWASGIEAASRIASLLAVLAFADEEARAALDTRARAFLEAHAVWIARYPSLYSSANNHRVAELAALFLVGHALPGMRGAGRMVRKSRQGLEREILRQYLPDGVGAEQSPTYAAYSLEWFLLAAIAAEAVGEDFSPAYRARLRLATEHLKHLMDDAGCVPQIGDDDEGRVLRFNLSANRYVASIVRRAGEWLGDESQPSTGVFVYPDGGYTIIRSPSGQGTLVTVFDHGPLGFLSIAAHGHADALSLWLSWGDEQILVDAGTYLYHAGAAWRDRFRGTSVHNTLTLDGADQSIIAGPFNWSHHAGTRVVARTANSVTAEHDGYRSRYGVVHRRSVTRETEGVLVVEDHLLGTAKRGPLNWQIGFTLAPGANVRIEGRKAWITTPAGRKLSAEIETDAQWMVEQTCYSPGFNQLTETLRLETRGTLSGDSLVGRVRLAMSPS
jgi:hypothetical protein